MRTMPFLTERFPGVPMIRLYRPDNGAFVCELQRSREGNRTVWRRYERNGNPYKIGSRNHLSLISIHPSLRDAISAVSPR